MGPTLHGLNVNKHAVPRTHLRHKLAICPKGRVLDLALCRGAETTKQAERHCRLQVACYTFCSLLPLVAKHCTSWMMSPYLGSLVPAESKAELAQNRYCRQYKTEQSWAKDNNVHILTYTISVGSWKTFCWKQNYFGCALFWCIASQIHINSSVLREGRGVQRWL